MDSFTRSGATFFSHLLLDPLAEIRHGIEFADGLQIFAVAVVHLHSESFRSAGHPAGQPPDFQNFLTSAFVSWSDLAVTLIPSCRDWT